MQLAQRQMLSTGLLDRFGDKWGLVPQLAGYAIDYLERYGYLDRLRSITVGDIIEAIRKFQTFTELLKPDAELGPLTLGVMQLPRCGCPDFGPQRRGINRWGKKELTYRFISYVPGISEAEQEAAFFNGGLAWSEVCGIRLVPTDRHDADITIEASSDRRMGFGSPGGTLAAAQLPPTDNFRGQLKMWYDSAERWKIRLTEPGVHKETVDVHELGHIIGMDHGGRGIMQPFYVETINRPQPGYDTEQSVLRYGEPTNDGSPSDPSWEHPDQLEVSLELMGQTYSGTVHRVGPLGGHFSV